MATLPRNLFASLAGVSIPLVAAAVAIPVLIAHMGMTRFGVFALLLAASNYAAFLDLGLSSAVTYRLMKHDQPEAGGVTTVHVALCVVAALGLLVMAAIFLSAPAVGAWMPGAEASFVAETVWSVRVLSLSLPAILLASVLAGVLSAQGRFVAINRVRAPIGTLVYLGPALASIWSPSMVASCAVLVVLRVLQAVLHGWQCCEFSRDLWRIKPQWSSSELKALLRYGGWLTVSSVIGPLMVYADRFYVGAIRSAQEVAWYVAPYEVATKITLIPGAVMPVLFALFLSQAARRRHDDDWAPAITAGLGVVCAIPAVVVCVFATDILDRWLGGQLPPQSAVVLQILAAAALVNCIALVFFTHVQARGRTDLLARIHCAELLPYFFVLAALTQSFGIVGVAMAWGLRIVVDAALLCHLAAGSMQPDQRRVTWRILFAVTGYSACLASLSLVDATWVRAFLLSVPLLAAWLMRDWWWQLVIDARTPSQEK